MTNPKVYSEGLTISQAANTGKLKKKDGQSLSRVGIWQRAVRSLLQAEGKLASPHPLGYPELHMDDGTVGVAKVSENLIVIHPRAIENNEQWRVHSENPGHAWRGTFARPGPKAGGEKPYVAKSKAVSDWLKKK